MRSSGGALLIVLGMLALWLAITGRFDRMAAAWDYVKGSTDSLPSGGASGVASLNAGSVLHALPALAPLIEVS